MIGPSMVSRLSGEPRAVAYYVRNKLTDHLLPQTNPHRYRPGSKPNPYKREYEREKDRRVRRAPAPAKKPKAPATRSTPPMNKHQYADMARRPFGTKLSYSSASTATRSLRLAGRVALRRFRLPLDLLLRVVAQGNITQPAAREVRAAYMVEQGWQNVSCTGAPIPTNPYRSGTGRQGLSVDITSPLCYTPNQVPASWMDIADLAYQPSATVRTILFGPASSFVDRFHVYEHYRRGNSSPRLSWRRNAVVVPDGLTRPPAVDPMELPIKLPVPTPQPIPYRLIPERVRNPYRVEQSEGSQPSLQTALQPVGFIPPSYIPVDEIVITPPPPGKPGGAPVVSTPKPAWHSRRPPRKREKESKIVIQAGVVKLLLNTVTESLDLLDAFYYALPKSVQAKEQAKLPQEKYFVVWGNLDKVSIPVLVQNIIVMLVTDWVAGTWGRKQQEANRSLYEDFGIDLQGHLPKETVHPNRLIEF